MTAPVPGMACCHCVFFDKTAENFGECRRYAPRPNQCEYVPKIHAVGSVKVDVHWPKVYDNNWCGQFSGRKPDQLPADTPKKAAIRPVPVPVPKSDGSEPKLALAPEIESPDPAPKIDIG